MLAAPAGAAAVAVLLALSSEAQEPHLRHLQKRLPRAREEEEEGRVRAHEAWGTRGPRGVAPSERGHLWPGSK